MNNFFLKCEMVIYSSYSLKRGKFEILLPIKLHIKDIRWDFFEDNHENVLEEYSRDYSKQIEAEQIEERYLNILKNIDIKQFIFDDDILEEYRDIVERCRDGYVFKDIRGLYSFLINFIKMSEVDFVLLEKEIRNQKIKLVEKFRQMVEKEMNIGSGSEKASESYMTLRCAFELNRPPLFKENIGLSISEMSYRELFTQRIYMARKCEIEKIQYDKLKKGNKRK